jgi:hypothetical protein
MNTESQQPPSGRRKVQVGEGMQAPPSTKTAPVSWGCFR